MRTAEIRRRWLDYFERQGHVVVPSASLISDDPSLLFTVAGMVPFIPYMLGQQEAPWPRATSVQKCVRTQDIEEVGKTTRHGTFFKKNDNYWHTGQPGPAGPCSEIYIDRGPAYGPDGGPVVDEDRFLEIWNLVFMQYAIDEVRAKDDFRIAGELSQKNIDTGMGLERVAFLLQSVDNLYEIDEVFPVITAAQE